MLTNFRACRQTWPVSVELDQTYYFHVFRNKNCKSSNGIAWLHYQDSSNSFHKQEQENYIWLPIHFSVQRVQQPKRHTCYLVQIRAFSDYCQVYRKGWFTKNFLKTDQNFRESHFITSLQLFARLWEERLLLLVWSIPWWVFTALW